MKHHIIHTGGANGWAVHSSELIIEFVLRERCEERCQSYALCASSNWQTRVSLPGAYEEWPVRSEEMSGCCPKMPTEKKAQKLAPIFRCFLPPTKNFRASLWICCCRCDTNRKVGNVCNLNCFVVWHGHDCFDRKQSGLCAVAIKMCGRSSHSMPMPMPMPFPVPPPLSRTLPN